MTFKLYPIIIALAALSLAACSSEKPSDNKTVENLFLTPDKLEMKVGEKFTITANVLPEDASGYVVTWSSSDSETARVSPSGTVYALAEGTATVTASTGDISATAEITVTSSGSDPDPDPDNPDPEPSTDPEPGDYFYSDGSWSSELNSEKEVIGIVFWTGDPAKDDPTLRQEHPECTHGLVVAVSGDKYVPWQSGYAQYGKTVNEWIEGNTSYEDISESTLNLIRGYNNTRAIEAFNADPSNSAWPVEAVNAVVEYRVSNPAPDNTSGWYLPSIKEYVIMCYKESEVYAGTLPGTDNYYMLNDRLANVPGAQSIGSDGLGFYSSSTEGLVNTAYAISFCYQTVAVNTKDNASLYSVRFILAF